MFPVVFSFFRGHPRTSAPKSRTDTTGRGLIMKKLTIAAVAAFALATGSASAADLVTKAKPIVAPEPPAWDFAFGSAIASDYIFRGVTQSNHKPSVAAYFEPRYNINKDLQLYAGLGGASISFPNRAAAEVDFYAGGVRRSARSRSTSAPGTTGTPAASASRRPASCAPSPSSVNQCLPNGNVIKEEAGHLGSVRQGELLRDRQLRGGRLCTTPRRCSTPAPTACSSAGPPSTPSRLSANGVQPYVSAKPATGTSARPMGSTAALSASVGCWRQSGGIPLPGLHHLERRLRLDLEGVHG